MVWPRTPAGSTDFDDHIAAQQGDLAAMIPLPQVGVCDRPIERERHAVDRCDDALFGERTAAFLRRCPAYLASGRLLWTR